MTTCNHCKMNVDIRNPSGFCDHLYYPDYCDICNAPSIAKRRLEKAAPLLLEACEKSLIEFEFLRDESEIVNGPTPPEPSIIKSLKEIIAKAKGE